MRGSLIENQNILAIVAHHDDIELGCGGTLAKFAYNKNSVYGLVLTDSITNYNIGDIVRTKDRIDTESKKAAKILGYKYILLKSPLAKVGELTYNVEVMREIESVLNDYSIDMIFTHWNNDVNTDHMATYQLAVTAGRHTPTILMFRSNWYQKDKPFNSNIFFDISNFMDLKIKALNAFSQEVENRGNQWIDNFINRERKNGYIINTEFAESFEAIRYAIKDK